MRVVVISGLSGAGKSTALAHLEDLGYFAVDNLPPALWTELVATLKAAGVRRVALGIDARARAFLDAATFAIDAVAGAGAEPVLVFLEARPEVLLARYNLTRRTHPLRGGHLLREIEAERGLLAPLRGRADWILDTSETGPGELGQRLAQLLGEERPFVLRLISFGYKWGPPQVADLLLDVRALPNPHWEEALRPRTGTDPEVAAYVFSGEAEPYYRALKETATRAAAGGGRGGGSGGNGGVGGGRGGG
ncbi:RNase adapter RapZ, partial [Oceanithermus sp.]